MSFFDDFIEDLKIAFYGSISPDLNLFDKTVYRVYLMVYIAVMGVVLSAGAFFLLYGGEVLFNLLFG